MKTKQPTKAEMGVLSQFSELIVFLGNESGSGFFLEATDMQRMKKGVTKVFKEKPQLREMFRQCLNESAGLIVVP